MEKSPIWFYELQVRYPLASYRSCCLSTLCVHNSTMSRARVTWMLLLTEPDESQCLSPDPRGSWRHLSDLLHALDPRALPERLGMNNNGWVHADIIEHYRSTRKARSLNPFRCCDNVHSVLVAVTSNWFEEQTICTGASPSHINAPQLQRHSQGELILE